MQTEMNMLQSEITRSQKWKYKKKKRLKQSENEHTDTDTQQQVKGNIACVIAVGNENTDLCRHAYSKANLNVHTYIDTRKPKAGVCIPILINKNTTFQRRVCFLLDVVIFFKLVNVDIL